MFTPSGAKTMTQHIIRILIRTPKPHYVEVVGETLSEATDKAKKEIDKKSKNQ
jgi:hypothetical protein